MILPFPLSRIAQVKFEPRPAMTRWSRWFKRQGQAKAEQVQATLGLDDVLKKRAQGSIGDGDEAPGHGGDYLGVWS